MKTVPTMATLIISRITRVTPETLPMRGTAHRGAPQIDTDTHARDTDTHARDTDTHAN